MTMYLLFLLCLLEGILCDTPSDKDNVNLFLGNGDIKHRVTRATDQSTENFRCQNVYEADRQLFHVFGKQWRSDAVALAEGYVLTRGIGAHKLHQSKMTWNDARKTCRREGGNLVVLNSLAEESVLLRVMREHAVNTVWVGVHDIFEEGDWITVTGESMERAGYEKWSTTWPNQPDNYKGAQNCGRLEQIGGIDDDECRFPYPFICEIDVY